MKEKEPNVLQNYFIEKIFEGPSSTCDLLDILRQAGIKKETPKISARKMKDSEEEFRLITNELDHLLPLISQKLSHLFLGKTTKKRLISIIEGYFHKYKYLKKEGETLHTILPADLGTNPFNMFERHEDITVDAFVTQDAIKKYIDLHRKQIQRAGFYEFEATSSRFFYFRENDLVKKGFILGSGDIDFDRLVPLIVELPHPGEVPIPEEYKHKGYVGLKELPRPTGSRVRAYEEKAMEHFSYRFKQTSKSLVPKLSRLLILPKDDKKYRPIDDLLAFRGLCSDQDKVRELEKKILESEIISEELIKYRDDHYEKPKDNGYQALKMALVTGNINQYFRCVIEVQILDLLQYRKNELDPTDPAHHSQQKKKTETTKKQYKKTREDFEKILNKIYRFNPIVVFV